MVKFTAFSYQIIDSLRQNEAEIPMNDFLDSPPGKFILERNPKPTIKRFHDYEEDCYIYVLEANLSKEDYIVYKLKYE